MSHVLRLWLGLKCVGPESLKFSRMPECVTARPVHRVLYVS